MPTSAQSAAPPLDVQSLREREFPFVGRAPYLNAASAGPLPERARRAVEAYNFRRSSIHDLRGDDFEPTLHRAREACARLVGAGADEIALVSNTSHGINVAAQCLTIEPGKRVIVSDREFPANVYPWLRLPREEGVRVDLIPTDERGFPDEARLHEELAKGDVAVLAISAVQYLSGYLADLPALGRAAREHGAWFVVDAIQALGCVPLDVKACEIDVLATGCQKWLCSPFGTGFLYVRRELVPHLEPKNVGWTAMQGTLDHADLLHYRYELWETARRFEVATQPWQDIAGMTESVNLLMETGIETIHAHVLSLQEPLIGWLGERGIEIATDLRPEKRSGIFSFRPESPEQAFRALHKAGVKCVLREGLVRLSPHLYNTAEDIQAVIDVLSEREGW